MTVLSNVKNSKKMDDPQNSDLWEKKYSQGKECNLAPFDEVIAFVYRNKPDQPNYKIRILEIGCGVGNNLDFLARQKFSVHGIDISETAVRIAQEKLLMSGLWGNRIEIGSFERLPYDDGFFDLVIDRAALAYADDATVAVSEAHRVLRCGGKILSTPFSSPDYKNNGKWYYQADVLELFNGWKIESMHRVDTVDVFGDCLNESHFRIVARKE